MLRIDVIAHLLTVQEILRQCGNPYDLDFLDFQAFDSFTDVCEDVCCRDWAYDNWKSPVAPR